MTKCIIVNCEKPKTPGQVACSVKHGYEFRTIRETITKVQDNPSEKWQEWLGYYTVEQIQAYASYPYKY